MTEEFNLSNTVNRVCSTCLKAVEKCPEDVVSVNNIQKFIDLVQEECNKKPEWARIGRFIKEKAGERFR